MFTCLPIRFQTRSRVSADFGMIDLQKCHTCRHKENGSEEPTKVVAVTALLQQVANVVQTIGVTVKALC